MTFDPDVLSTDLVLRNDALYDRTSGSLFLDKPATVVSQVSPARAQALAKMGIRTVRDLLENFPRRYIDLTKTAQIAFAEVGGSFTICGTVHEVKLKKPRRNLSLTEISIVDETGILIVTMFRMPWLAKQIVPGDRLAVAGKVELNYGFKRMTNPLFEKLEGGEGAIGRIVPVHPSCEKVSAVMMRRIVGNALAIAAQMPDPLPLDLRIRGRLMSRGAALRCVHFPETMAEAAEARRRIAYEEVLLLQLKLIGDARKRAIGKTVTQHVVEGPRQTALRASLPFRLTEDQGRAINDLNVQLSAPYAANHLMLGDVGTGKTVVAAFGLAACADTGTQAFLLAPTEVLASQHAKSLGTLMDAIGVTWELLTGSTSKDDRERIVAAAAAGTLDVLIGTHALLEDDVRMPHCSLVIIDEQQRFGVEQREKLISKGECPDALYLTATPIPRTLALAVHGNLTLSYLHQRPLAAHRETHALASSVKGHAYDAALAACKRGEQVFIVCPLIGVAQKADNAKNRNTTEEELRYAFVEIEDESDFSGENITAATDHAAFLQSKVFVDYRVGLLHGKLSASDKDAVMESFRTGETQVLVSTTVIEVGVDVPNATVMIVEDADRFGLSQLHQLRGRVGRGSKNAEVYLISNTKNEDALKRLSAMEKTEDGMELASFDLSLRREGDILGNRQHGASTLKLVNIMRDGALIEAAHRDASAIIDGDPQLKSPEHLLLSKEMRLRFPDESHTIGG